MTDNIYYNRLKIIWESLGCDSANSFAKMMGYDRSEKINKLSRDEKFRPSVDLLEDVLKKFPQINGNWLITGTGKPFLEYQTKEKEEVIAAESEVKIIDCLECIKKQKRIDEKDKEINRLNAMLVDTLIKYNLLLEGNKKDEGKCG